jgi:hypothetical protein
MTERSLRVVLHFLCFCRNRSPDSSIWRINRGDSQYNRVLRVLPFPKSPAIGSLCFRMSVKLERFDHAFPYDLIEITFRHRRGIKVCGAASGVLLNILANGLYAFAHASTISTRSRTVHKLFVS